MQVIRSMDELREWVDAQAGAGNTIALVPTMGYLHEGHLSLCRKARTLAKKVVASIYVNPTQFGPNEDLSTYPRDEGSDLVKLADAGVDMAFLPTNEMVYPDGFCTYVQVHGITEPLCGASRPGHFRGVATVVTKLFNMVQPDYAVFGLKDYQQFLVIRRMVKDLNLRVEVVGSPTVREPDGLALSSRNAYLSPAGRKAAVVLNRSLRSAQAAYKEGLRDPQLLRQKVLELIAREPLARVDYVEVVDAETLSAASSERPMLIAMAVFVERPRLIDNTVLGTSM